MSRFGTPAPLTAIHPCDQLLLVLCAAYSSPLLLSHSVDGLKHSKRSFGQVLADVGAAWSRNDLNLNILIISYGNTQQRFKQPFCIPNSKRYCSCVGSGRREAPFPSLCTRGTYSSSDAESGALLQNGYVPWFCL